MKGATIGLTSLLLSVAALANDTVATKGAGGIEIRNSDTIDMVSEDLYVSGDEIRVKYRFRHRGPKDFTTIVAFPMPDRSLADEYGGDIAYPSDFETIADGKKVKATLERAAIARNKEHRAYLEKLGLPVAPDTIADMTRLLDALPDETKKELIERGLAGEEEWDDDGKGMKKHLIPLWVVRDTWWWEQSFPAGRDLIVEHRYKPGAGGTIETPLTQDYFRKSREGRQEILKYCVDQSFLKGLDRLASQPASVRPGLPDTRIDYILKTAANWLSPVKEFRLVVDKGDPRNLVSFCGKGIKKISPTQFELRQRNWRPYDDLYVLIVEPQPQYSESN